MRSVKSRIVESRSGSAPIASSLVPRAVPVRPEPAPSRPVRSARPVSGPPPAPARQLWGSRRDPAEAAPHETRLEFGRRPASRVRSARPARRNCHRPRPCRPAALSSRFPSRPLPPVSRAHGTRRRPPGARIRALAAPPHRACRSAFSATRRAGRSSTAPCALAGSPSIDDAGRLRTERAPDRAPRTRPAASRPATSSRARTTASRTPAIPRSAASISPGSTRKPRSLICPSTRPRYSRSPSGKNRTRSPVR